MKKIKSKINTIKKTKYYDLFVIISSVLVIAGIFFILWYFKPTGEGITSLGIVFLVFIAFFFFFFLMRKILFMIDKKFKEEDKKFKEDDKK